MLLGAFRLLGARLSDIGLFAFRLCLLRIENNAKNQFKMYLFYLTRSLVCLRFPRLMIAVFNLAPRPL